MNRASCPFTVNLMNRTSCPFKVNLIPYNPTGMYDGSSRDAIAAFKHELDRARLPATVRLTRGRDIAAACGQLAGTPISEPIIVVE
jgi:23S rRNA (adenine2503-C2)-methyltransferase